jgi:2-isopropylmalate synthase
VWGELMRTLIERVPGAEQVVWSTHCHNDLGMAVANSLSAVLAGARQVECTINGLGERAGNASLEEVVMAVRTRSDLFPVQTRIDTTQIVPASKLVSQITGLSGAAEQGRRRRQCLCARIRDSSGRRAQAP